jgi:hypothetical protein
MEEGVDRIEDSTLGINAIAGVEDGDAQQSYHDMV